MTPPPPAAGARRNDDAAPDSPAKTTDVAAVVACEEYKVASQNDKEKLALAKAKTYKLGFYEGRMCIGEYKGETVQDAKNKARGPGRRPKWSN